MGLRLLGTRPPEPWGEIARGILPDGDRQEVVIEVKDEAGQRVLVAKLSVSFEPTELPGFSPVE